MSERTKSIEQAEQQANRKTKSASAQPISWRWETNKLTSWMRRAVVYAGLGSLAFSQQSPPEMPFQAVHMIAATKADDEKKLVGAMDDFNSAIAKGGCPPCIYHFTAVRLNFGPIR